MSADLYQLNGEPLLQTPRLVLKNMLKTAAEQGYLIKTGVECEFFLLSADQPEISDPGARSTKPCYDQQALIIKNSLERSQFNN